MCCARNRGDRIGMYPKGIERIATEPEGGTFARRLWLGVRLSHYLLANVLCLRRSAHKRRCGYIGLSRSKKAGFLFIPIKIKFKNENFYLGINNPERSRGV